MRPDTHKILVDGFSLGSIYIAGTTQKDRDLIRKDIAKEYQVPAHYIRLSPIRRGV